MRAQADSQSERKSAGRSAAALLKLEQKKTCLALIISSRSESKASSGGR